MKSIKILSAWERADWLTRDPEGYWEFVQAEAKAAAEASRQRRSRSIFGRKETP